MVFRKHDEEPEMGIGVMGLLDEHPLLDEPPLDPLLHGHPAHLPTVSRQPSYSLRSLPDAGTAPVFLLPEAGRSG
jgi:hypothetical protein